MVKDPLMYVLIGVLALNVIIPKYVTLTTVTYAFIIYMLYVFVKGFKKKEEE